ncbi:MAG: hypothetical protein ABIK76_04470 [candidate division WOR-3 bacterium]
MNSAENKKLKTSWRYLSIVIISTLIVAGGILYYQKLFIKEIKTQSFEIFPKENMSKVETEEKNKDLIVEEIPEESLGEVSLAYLKKGKTKIGDFIIERIEPRIEENNIIFRIEDDIKVVSPRYKDEGSPSSWEAFERGYTIYYKDKPIYKDVATALDVFIFDYKNKTYIGIKIASAGTGGTFSYLSFFTFIRELKNLNFIDTISADGSLKDILKEINYLIQKQNL